MSKARERRPPDAAGQAREGTFAQAAFELRYAQDAASDIQLLDGSIRKKLRKILEKKLAADPEGYGLPLRHPLTNYWKHEFGRHRIIYRIYKDHSTVVVCAVGIRKRGDAEDIYRQLESLAKTGRIAEQLASVLKEILRTKK
jgi:mRNA-degrading endonuclease RelE of RelBE toxin-antitoxin system